MTDDAQAQIPTGDMVLNLIIYSPKVTGSFKITILVELSTLLSLYIIE